MYICYQSFSAARAGPVGWRYVYLKGGTFSPESYMMCVCVCLKASNDSQPQSEEERQAALRQRICPRKNARIRPSKYWCNSISAPRVGGLEGLTTIIQMLEALFQQGGGHRVSLSVSGLVVPLR